MKKFPFLSQIIRTFGAVVALAFGRFLFFGAERTIAPSWILLFLFCLIFMIRAKQRTRRKRSVVHFFVEFFLLFLFLSLLRLLIMDWISSFLGLTLGLTTSLVSYVSSGSNESGNSAPESGGPPPLESESSSASLNTFRNQIAADNEADIYRRIQILQNQEYYNLPPQNSPGDYERLVRENFNSAINVNHFRTIFDREYFELQVLERKGVVQDKLQDLMLREENISQILEKSPYSNIRKEAYYYLEDKLKPVSDPRHAFQRDILDASLQFFIQYLNLRGRHSSIYKEFQKSFMDE